MGNPSFSMLQEAKEDSSDHTPTKSRGSRLQQQQQMPRRLSSSNLHQLASSSSNSSSNGEILLPVQVAKLRIEEKYLSEEVETEGMERLAFNHIMNSVRDYAQPSPLGVWRRSSLAASG